MGLLDLEGPLEGVNEASDIHPTLGTRIIMPNHMAGFSIRIACWIAREPRKSQSGRSLVGPYEAFKGPAKVP